MWEIENEYLTEKFGAACRSLCVPCRKDEKVLNVNAIERISIDASSIEFTQRIVKIQRIRFSAIFMSWIVFDVPVNKTPPPSNIVATWRQISKAYPLVVAYFSSLPPTNSKLVRDERSDRWKHGKKKTERKERVRERKKTCTSIKRNKRKESRWPFIPLPRSRRGSTRRGSIVRRPGLCVVCERCPLYDIKFLPSVR